MPATPMYDDDDVYPYPEKKEPIEKTSSRKEEREENKNKI